MKANYSEFSDPRLVSIYNAVNDISDYKNFYLTIVKRLEAKKIIDIGCGTGLLTCELAKQNYEVIGIEPSEDMINIARKSESGDRVTWVIGDALKLKDHNADVAIMTGHVSQFYLEVDYWIKALTAINQALHLGGYLVFESRNPNTKPWFKGWPQSKKNANVYKDQVVGEVKWWYEPIETRKNRIIYKNRYYISNTGENLTSINELIFRSKNEIVNSLLKTGFTVEEVYGDWDGSKANEVSPELIFVAKKIR